MIKNFRMRISVDKRGHISSGRKRESGFPQALHYFDVSDFPELIDAYGHEPDKLVVMLPSNNIEDFFDEERSCWRGFQKGVKLRSCNEETCIHRVDETVAGVKYAAGEETGCICVNLPDKVPNPNKAGELMNNPDKCTYYASLKAFVAIPPRFNVDNAACYKFITHSANSGGHIKSEIMKIHAAQRGNLWGIPFEISVVMVPGKDDNKKRYPIWHFQMRGLFSDLREDRLLSEGIEHEDANIISEGTQPLALPEAGRDLRTRCEKYLDELRGVKNIKDWAEVTSRIARDAEDPEKLTSDEVTALRELARSVHDRLTQTVTK